jgi:hypothetical protein
VYVYDYAKVPSAEIAAARQQAESIFFKANIRISWIECRTTEREAIDDLPVCRTELGPDEVMLRILANGGSLGDRVTSLGFSLVNRGNAHEAWLSTVFADRVTALATQMAIDSAVLLGRAIAHELGHLLMGSADHGRSGLMRALWSDAELRGNMVSEWEFLVKEARIMRSSIATRISRNASARR